MADYDVVVVGAGHNGLVCGAYLAKHGLKVRVVERRPVVGGACVTEEFGPGFKASTAAYNFTLLQPKIVLDLDLLDHGLEIIKTPPLFQPLPDGRHIVLWDDPARTRAELAKLNPRDATRYPAYLEHLRRLAPVVRGLMWETPPDLQSRRARDRWNLLRLAWRNRSALRHAYDLQDLLTMSAYDYLGRWFSSDDVIAVLGFYANMTGSLASLATPGTAFSLIRLMIRDNTTLAGGWGVPRGGMGAVTQAIARSGARWGLEVSTGDPVCQIELANGRAKGIVLASGRRIASDIVVSGADLRTTFLQLMDPALCRRTSRKPSNASAPRARSTRSILLSTPCPASPPSRPPGWTFPIPSWSGSDRTSTISRRPMRRRGGAPSRRTRSWWCRRPAPSIPRWRRRAGMS